jgi:hypothetical protein
MDVFVNTLALPCLALPCLALALHRVLSLALLYGAIATHMTLPV